MSSFFFSHHWPNLIKYRKDLILCQKFIKIVQPCWFVKSFWQTKTYCWASLLRSEWLHFSVFSLTISAKLKFSKLRPKPSLKFGSVNKAFLFWYWQRLEKFFRNKTFSFFKKESWNFQNLFERISWNLTKFQLNQITSRKMKITIIWISWMSWNFVRYHEI